LFCIRTHGSTDLQRDSAKLRCVHDGWRLFFGADAVRNLRGFSAVCRQRPRTVIRCSIFDGSFRSEAGIACFAMYRGRGTCAVEVDAFWTCGSSPRPCELRVQLLCAQAKERCNALWFWVHGQCFLPPRKARLGELSKVDGNLPPSRHPDPFAEVRFVSHASSICRARDRTFFSQYFLERGVVAGKVALCDSCAPGRTPTRIAGAKFGLSSLGCLGSLVCLAGSRLRVYFFGTSQMLYRGLGTYHTVKLHLR